MQQTVAVQIVSNLLKVEIPLRTQWGRLARSIISPFLLDHQSIKTTEMYKYFLQQSKISPEKQPSLASLERIGAFLRKKSEKGNSPTQIFTKQAYDFLLVLFELTFKDNVNPAVFLSTVLRLAIMNPLLFCKALSEANSFNAEGIQAQIQHLTQNLINKAYHNLIKLTNRQYSELLYLNGYLNFLLNRVDQASTKIESSKRKNQKNIKALRLSLKINIRLNYLSSCIWQVKLLSEYSTKESCQFLVIKAVAQFLTKGKQQAWQRITAIKEELQVFPDREKMYFEINFSLGTLHFLLCDDNTAFNYFAKEYDINKNDISLVRIMGLCRYRMKDYASAMEYFDRVRQLGPNMANDKELMLTIICCLKTKHEEVAMQMIQQIQKRANCPFNIKYAWPHSLYLGILCHLGEDSKVFQWYNRLESKRSCDFQLIQLKIVMILCLHRRGEKQKVMQLLEEIHAIQDQLQLHKISISQHYILSRQLIFLVNYCQTNKLSQLELAFSQAIGKLLDYTANKYNTSSMLEPLLSRMDDFEIELAYH